MAETLAYATLVVREYDEAIEYFTRALGFALLEDIPLGQGKRWVVVTRPCMGHNRRRSLAGYPRCSLDLRERGGGDGPSEIAA